MTTNRDIIDTRILNHLKHELYPHYKVINVRTRWIGQRNGEKIFQVRYFTTSSKFIAGVRFDMVAVDDRRVRTITLEDE